MVLHIPCMCMGDRNRLCSDRYSLDTVGMSSSIFPYTSVRRNNYTQDNRTFCLECIVVGEGVAIV